MSITTRALTLPLFLTITSAMTAQTPTSAAQQPCKPPVTRKVDQVDDYHGTKIADPYRWLEDDNAADTKAWVEAQNCVTFAYLNQIPERSRFKDRLTQLFNYERFGVPEKKGGRYFFFKNEGLQNQAVLYTQPTLDATPTVLLDPNTLSLDGTVALSATAPSDDGRYYAYGTSASGSDWQEFFVRDVATGKNLSDHLLWIKFSGMSWTKDNAGFFYSRYPKPDSATAMQAQNRDIRIYYHRLGTDQAADPLIYARPDKPDWFLNAQVSEDGRYNIITLGLGTDSRNRVYYQDLADPLHPKLDAPVVPLLDDFDATYGFVGNDGPVFYFFTNQNASRGKLIAIDTRTPAKSAWREIIPQGADVLQSVGIVKNTFVADYLKDAHEELSLFDLTGKKMADVPLPTLGALAGVSLQRNDTEMFFGFTSFLYPTTIFRYDFTTNRTNVFKAPHLAFDASQYETKQVFYKSKDGTRVPMFITAKKGIKLDGSNPTYLTAYGGFDINMLPAFSTSALVWLEMGGIYAQPNLRGGAEYGEDWHTAGMHEKKQNVFDDFIAAAEYLIAQKYTSTPKLAIGGASNGGLLIGAVLNQRPELFGAALPAVGVMDMLRFHKFTIGWAWVTEYGSADSAAQFPYLLKYSPIHNIKAGTHYPPMMIETADHDDRVVPAHSFKYTATMQAAQGGSAPVLVRIETKAGHGGGKPTAKIIEDQADRWAFLWRNLGMSVHP
jgi:prolyl oligopeptidase